MTQLFQPYLGTLRDHYGEIIKITQKIPSDHRGYGNTQRTAKNSFS